MRTFGKILRSAIREKNLTLESTAKRAKTFKGYISGICTGSLNPPSPKMVRRLCTLLDLNFQDMLALSVLEKLPKELQYGPLRSVLNEAIEDGRTDASI